MTVSLSPLFNGWQGFSSNGIPLAGGLLTSFLAGTSTPSATFTDVTGAVNNSNPIVLAADGRPPFEIWLTQGIGYKFILMDALLNPIGTYDNIYGIFSVVSGSTVSITVNNIATLKTLPKTGIPDAIVMGYYNPGDGGGGNYYLDAADTTNSDNGGTIIVAADGGRWKLSVSGPVSIRQFGAKGDSNGTAGNGTNDFTAIQNAYSWGNSTGQTIYEPIGIYRTTSTLTCSSGLNINSDGNIPYFGSPAATTGLGAWHFFDHSGIGLQLISGGGANEGATFRATRYATRRAQPAPAGGWTPGAFDFDIQITNFDFVCDDLMTLNPTKGIQLSNGLAGRVEINRWRGQILQVGFQCDISADVCKINNVQFWPFWEDNVNIHTYTCLNADAIYLNRSDNPMFMNIFAIAFRSGFRFGQNVSGKTSKFKISNADIDNCKYGIWCDNTCTTGPQGQISNFTAQAPSGGSFPVDPTSKTIFVEGNACEIDIHGLRTDLVGSNAINIAGISNRISISEARLYNYDQANAGNVMATMTSGAGNFLEFIGSVKSQPNAPSAAGKYGGTGILQIYTPDFLTQSISSAAGTIASSVGTITTATGTLTYEQTSNASILISGQLTITTNGTGAGVLRVTSLLALNATVAFIAGTGRQVVGAGNVCSVTMAGGSLIMNIARYDNAYPGADGITITWQIEYPV